jgi:molybdate transport system substrate-binding protein
MIIRHQGQSARSRIALISFVASVLLLVALLAVWFRSGKSQTKIMEPLFVYCAAGIKAPVEAVVREYEKAYGTRVEVTFGPSQTLLANIALTSRGDLYIPADDSYIEAARKKNLAAEVIPLAEMTAVLAVKKGVATNIQSLHDLVASGLSVAQANPDAAAIGKLMRDALSKADWEALRAKTSVFKGTVTEVANDVKLGAVGATFIWDGMAVQYPDLQIVHLREIDQVKARVAAAVLNYSRQPTAALRFARFLSAQDKGLREFQRYGYKTLPGDRWAESPELRLYAGAMLRPAIEDTIRRFEQREGVTVVRVYNGCGILVSQMRTGERPDAYFACDTSFMREVTDMFVDSTAVSSNQLVILVPKGNPHQIKALKDLGRDGLKLGIGHEKQCALGVLTKNTLLTNGTYGAVMKNVRVQSPTGDFLVNQLRTGSLDAVIAYLSNATGSADTLEAVAIDIPCAFAAQPVAMSRETRCPLLTARLLAALKSAESKHRFEAAGFSWAAK